MLTMISPPFLSSLSYILLFGKRGIITADLLHLNFNPYGWHGIVIMQTFSKISLAALILTGGLSSIPSSVIEAAKDFRIKIWRDTLQSNITNAEIITNCSVFSYFCKKILQISELRL